MSRSSTSDRGRSSGLAHCAGDPEITATPSSTPNRETKDRFFSSTSKAWNVCNVTWSDLPYSIDSPVSWTNRNRLCLKSQTVKIVKSSKPSNIKIVKLSVRCCEDAFVLCAGFKSSSLVPIVDVFIHNKTARKHIIVDVAAMIRDDTIWNEPPSFTTSGRTVSVAS